MLKLILFIIFILSSTIKIIAQENYDTVYIIFNKNNSNQTIPIVEVFKNGKIVRIVPNNAKIYIFDYKYLAYNPNTEQKVSYYIRFENMNYRDSLPFTRQILNHNEIKEIKGKIILDEIDNYANMEAFLNRILGNEKTVYLIDNNDPQSDYIFLYKVFPLPLEPIKGNHQF